VIRDALPSSILDGIAALDFSGDDARERYDLLLVTSCALAFEDPEVRRVEVAIAATDSVRRRALHRAGFRLEGTARARLVVAGVPVDELHYARLRSDDTGGRLGFTAVMNTVTARKRLISHLLLTDAAGRVCILETTFKPDFELPGGILEPGESPRVGLIREVEEELDHTISVGRLLVVDWLAPYLGWEDAVELIFDGREMPDRSIARLRADGREIRAIHWLEPEAAIATMAPFAQGRLRAALDAREEGRTLYLEAGVRIS
jgi:8-oxo-dGTP pyrophosphatase MutT (NUDIX family)